MKVINDRIDKSIDPHGHDAHYIRIISRQSNRLK